mmetsp:Transcript_81231/g.197219  ORF Transcript_81231/g.197219 Transcript_81231/m.197219 type:complete len:346 (-) Transcript_81231:717-1754(-)
MPLGPQKAPGCATPRRPDGCGGLARPAACSRRPPTRSTRCRVTPRGSRQTSTLPATRLSRSRWATQRSGRTCRGPSPTRRCRCHLEARPTTRRCTSAHSPHATTARACRNTPHASRSSRLTAWRSRRWLTGGCGRCRRSCARRGAARRPSGSAPRRRSIRCEHSSPQPRTRRGRRSWMGSGSPQRAASRPAGSGSARTRSWPSSRESGSSLPRWSRRRGGRRPGARRATSSAPRPRPRPRHCAARWRRGSQRCRRCTAARRRRGRRCSGGWRRRRPRWGRHGSSLQRQRSSGWPASARWRSSAHGCRRARATGPTSARRRRALPQRWLQRWLLLRRRLRSCGAWR